VNKLSKDKRKDDPFNPTYRQPKEFTRKSNRNKIIFIVVLCFIDAYGSRLFIFDNTINIRIRRINGKMTTTPMLTNGSIYYFFENYSPWEIRLKFECDEWFNTSYDDKILPPDRTIGISFKSNTVQRLGVTWKKE